MKATTTTRYGFVDFIAWKLLMKPRGSFPVGKGSFDFSKPLAENLKK